MNEKYKIYIAEDDKIIARELGRTISSWGFEVRCAENFADIAGEVREYSPHLVLMDLLLPNYNGFYWCSEIRKFTNVPLVFISSVSDNMNIIMAMNAGGDDYVTKPFDLAVLISKIQAILRRVYNYSMPAAELSHRGAVFNPGDCTLRYDGRKIELSKNESKILHLLLQSKGKIISRDTLMQKLWETDSFVDENTLSVNVARLRKKLDELGIDDFIVTKKGLGYMIETEESGT